LQAPSTNSASPSHSRHASRRSPKGERPVEGRPVTPPSYLLGRSHATNAGRQGPLEAALVASKSEAAGLQGAHRARTPPSKMTFRRGKSDHGFQRACRVALLIAAPSRSVRTCGTASMTPAASYAQTAAAMIASLGLAGCAYVALGAVQVVGTGLAHAAGRSMRSAGAAEPSESAARPQASLRNPPTGAGGYEFGWMLERARQRCAFVGGDWGADDAAVRGRLPVPNMITARCESNGSGARLRFCNARLCSVIQIRACHWCDEPDWMAHAVVAARDSLVARYGPITARTLCAPGDACTLAGEVRRLYLWKWSSGQSVEMSAAVVDGVPFVVVTTTAATSR